MGDSMNDLTRNARTPAEEDPLVHGFLMTLPHFAPRAGIENRVLTHVRLPFPPWLRQLREQAQSPGAIRAMWMVVGVFAAATAATVSGVIAITITYWAELTAGLSRFGEHIALPALRVVPDSSEELLLTLNAMIAELVPSGTTLMLGAAISTVIFALCAWGLHRTIRQVQRSRVLLYGTR